MFSRQQSPLSISHQNSLRGNTMELTERRFVHPNSPGSRVTTSEGKEIQRELPVTSVCWVSNTMVF
jgi:hypothetical protein